MDTRLLFKKWADFHRESDPLTGKTFIKPFYNCEFGSTYVSIDGLGNESLFIELDSISAAKFKNPKLYGIVFEAKAFPQIRDDIPLLRIGLANGVVLTEAFEAFAVTLVGQIALFKDKLDVIEAIYDVCDDYAEFFGHGGKTTLSAAEEQGLFGELMVLKGVLKRFGGQAIACWTGPDKNKHDFIFANDDAIEVKTSRAQTRKVVKISNENQLSSNNDAKLFLKYIVVEPNPSGRTLSEQIDDIYDNLLHGEAQKHDFSNKLLQQKVLRGELPSSKKFVVVSEEFYEIGEGFPRLSKDLIQGISDKLYDVQYKVSLDGLTPYQGDPYDLLDA